MTGRDAGQQVKGGTVEAAKRSRRKIRRTKEEEEVGGGAIGGQSVSMK